MLNVQFIFVSKLSAIGLNSFSANFCLKKQKSAFQKIKLSDFERKKKKFFEFRIMGCLGRVLERKVWICEKTGKD